VVASDFCHPMLTLAVEKCRTMRVNNIEADTLALPLPDGAFDAVTIAFGLRNLQNPRNGLGEMHRVLKRGGGLVILEFSKPVVPLLGAAFNFYFQHVLPKLGAAISGDGRAYQYLPDSVRQFPAQEELMGWLRSAGFQDVGYRNLSGGIAALHWGRKGM